MMTGRPIGGKNRNWAKNCVEMGKKVVEKVTDKFNFNQLKIEGNLKIAKIALNIQT
jgi:hypothetical protein